MRAHLRNREAGQEPLKECALVQASQAPPQLALGCAWRANEQYVLTCKRCKQQEADLHPGHRSQVIKLEVILASQPDLQHCTQEYYIVPRHARLYTASSANFEPS